MNTTWRTALTLAATLWLAACGGGRDTDRDSAGDTARVPAAARLAAAALAARAVEGPQRRALDATPGAGVDPADAADQLMDFAEVYYPEYFPGHPASATLEAYRYRAYPGGIYLAVREGQVYVLGGSFGNEVLAVGALTSFITPAPRVASGVCAQAGQDVAGFVTPFAAVGKNAALTVAGCSGALGTPVWRQTEGPAVTLVSGKSQTLSFDPPEPGRYGFQLSFVDSQGTPRTQDLAFTAAAAPGSGVGLTVRASQSVRAGGGVSVRAWPTLPAGDSVKRVAWTQIEGPAVTLDTSTSRLALFTAPKVTRDTVIRLRATLYTTQGRSDSDEVLVLVEAYPQAPANDGNALFSQRHVPRTYAYLPDGRHAGALQRCVYDPALIYWGTYKNTCLLRELPFLAQETGGQLPTVEQVMGRVLVTHDFLGRNFEAFLRTHDTRGDFRRMLNSVTAIVIGSSVRPSHYQPVTGAIYLDGDNFWLNAEERDTINEAPDYRSEFGSTLQFADLWRYVQNGRNLFAYFDPRERITRTLEDVRNESVQLLYHELGHALDYVPTSAYGTLLNGRSVWDNVAPRYAAYQLTSDVVSTGYPLQSQELFGLGQVLYEGATADAVQRAYTPDQVAAFFDADLATDLYNYSDPAEDIAMTLEEVLMQRRLGIPRDVAFTDAIPAGATGSMILVRWGQRGRVGEPKLRPRASAIVQALTPWFDPAELDALPAPAALRAGESWTANLSGTLAGPQGARPLAIPRQALPPDALPSLRELGQMQKALRRMHEQRQARGLQRTPPGAR